MVKAPTIYPWEVTPEKVEAAIRKIVEVARPVKLIVFGSYVRGETNINSDVDFLIVVGDDVKDPRGESVRIREALGEILMPMDILVIPDSRWQEMKEIPGLIYREALKTGEIVYES
jgi:predicted nucleotidyltransferase